MSDLIDVEIRALEQQSARVTSYELVTLDGKPLPAANAGDHIDVHIAVDNGDNLIRQYSLCAQPGAQGYRIGVQREDDGQGGSRAIHARWQVGTRLQISPPRNLFALVDNASHSILMGGGIGITPVLSMAWQLHQQGCSFELHYSVRSLADAAFIRELQQSPFVERVHLYIANDGGRVDMARLLVRPQPNTHLFACGPVGYMDAIWQTADTMGWNHSNLHREYFDAPAVETTSDEAAFTVRLHSSGQEFEIAADQSIAAVLMEAGVDVPVSCGKGICGSCMTRVVDGQPEHRDLYLTEEEQASNQWITPCCSRSASPLLVLDL